MRYIISFILLSLLANPAIAALKLETIADKLSHPWGMSLLNENEIIVSERKGRLLRIALSDGRRTQIANLPEIYTGNQGGLLDVLSQRDSEGNDHIFFCYSKPSINGAEAATAVNRAILKNNVLTEQKNIFIANDMSSSKIHFGCRIVIKDNHIFIAVGERGKRDNAQNGQLHSGGVVRLRLDGGIPSDNQHNKGWLAELMSKGHRNPQGMAINPSTGEIWVNEHGPRGGDEINILTAGANYGWPIVSLGREYFGGKVGEGIKSAEGYEESIWHWVPSIAPSGMAFYEGEMFPEFRGDLLVSSLKLKSLYHIEIKANRPIGETALLKKKIGRIRDVEIAPDGSILLLSDEENGGLYRLSK